MIDERRVRDWQRWPTLTVDEASFVSQIPARKIREYVRSGALQRARLPASRQVLVSTSSLAQLLGVTPREPATESTPAVPLRPQTQRKLRAALRSM